MPWYLAWIAWLLGDPAVFFPPAPADGGGGGEPPQAVAAPDPAAVHDSAMVIDLHADVVYAVAGRGRDFATGDGEWTIARARQGGQDAQFFPLWVRPGAENAAETLKRLARTLDEMIAASDGALALVRTSAEIRERAASGGIGALLGIEGADALGDDPAAVDPYVARGLRYLGLTWNASNAFAEAAAEGREPHGLTDAGRALVERCNGAGVLVDLAHASAATFWDAFRGSGAPLLVSHAGLKALRPVSRNIDDLQLLALARSGGVIGIVFHSGFLADLPEGQTTAPLAALVAHLDHARALGAAAALALGSDFDGGIHPPEGLGTASDVRVITEALFARGWPEPEVRGVLGENVLRLLDAADAATDDAAPPAREWPAEIAVDGGAEPKDVGALSDRLIVAGPSFAGGSEIAVRWTEEDGASAAALEVWGEPGAVLALDAVAAEASVGAVPGGPGDSAARIAEAALGSDGRLRLDLPAGLGGGLRLGIRAPQGDSEVRLDEIVVWLR